jgi:hypothetical protein
MDGIPHNLDENSERNYKINELITIMFKMVKQLKKQKSKLATTLKYLMNMCYGTSMIKSQFIKTKYTSNVDKKVEEMYPFIAKYSFKSDKTGFVATVNTFHPHFNHVQFAKSILDNYHKKVDELSKLVRVFYYNIDSFLINENDYNKLVDLGKIGNNLGQFKLICVFNEVVFKSARKWMGLLDNNEIYCRPKNLIEKYNFEEFRDANLK